MKTLIFVVILSCVLGCFCGCEAKSQQWTPAPQELFGEKKYHLVPDEPQTQHYYSDPTTIRQWEEELWRNEQQLWQDEQRMYYWQMIDALENMQRGRSYRHYDFPLSATQGFLEGYQDYMRGGYFRP